MVISNLTDLSTVDSVKAKVEIYDGSTLVTTCTCSDNLQDFTISREGDTSKFFGFGICHQMKLNLIDLNRELTVIPSNTAKVCLGDGTIFDCPYPDFYITEVSRNEDDNTITATAYDLLYKASSHTYSELGLTLPYTIYDLVISIARLLGLSSTVKPSGGFSYIANINTANFDGTENLRTVLDAVAEVTQSIYYINYENKLVFKSLSLLDEPDFTIDRDTYFEMNTKTPRKLVAICSTTELGDNIIATTGEEGVTQYIRDNPLWVLRDDIGELVNAALVNAATSIMNYSQKEITQFYCNWAGNHLLEIGDKIALETEDGSIVYSYVLNDTVTYDGFLEEVTEWEFTESESETAANPSTLGEALNKTFAKVDKASREITLLASQADSTNSAVSQLQINTNNISASVQTIEKELQDSTDTLNQSIETLTKQVDLKVSNEEVTIAISTALEEGVDKVTTTTKQYTFDDEGLNISNPNNPISTTITEDGMKVYRNSTEVLTADNTGVKAEDLHATTFLLIGDNSRLESYNRTRTACFWIGD